VAHLVRLTRARILPMDSIALVVALLFAVAGFAIGFSWARSRASAGGQRLAELEAQLAATRENANRLGVQSAELEGEAVRLRSQLLESVQHASALEERTRQLQARLTEERAETQENLKLMAEAQRTAENAFKALSADALRSNNQSFLALAKATLAEFQQGAKGDLEKRQIAIDALVAPVKASLDKVDEKIGALERARELAYGEIKQQFAHW
jgi:DNA recombination protein RmuC